MKRRRSDWLKYVKMYVDNGVPTDVIAKKYKLDASHLKHKIKVYMIHGESPFTDEQEKRIYTREEKLKAIKTVLSGEKSGRQMAAEIGTPDSDTVNEWIKLYKKKGEDGIQTSWGRKNYMLHKERQRYLADKEIKAKCKHLEEENEFLKKSLALALRKDKRLRKKYKSLMSLRAELN